MVRLVIVFFFLLLTEISWGQRLVFSDVEKLPKVVNTDAEEIAPLLSADGITLYFSRLLSDNNTGGKYAGSDVYSCRYDVTTLNWKPAENLSAINDKTNNQLIGLNLKGDLLYSFSTTPSKNPSGLYVTKRVNGVLGKPEFLPMSGLQSIGFIGGYVTPEEDVLIVSMSRDDSRGEEDLYVSVKTGNSWSSFVNMGSTINTKGFEISPFLSADKKRLYFSSNGHPGLGDGDIFYSERLYNSWEAWTTPVNLGPQLNSKNFEAYFSIYGDSVAYFSSNNNLQSSSSDIYRCKVIIKGEVPDVLLTQEEVQEIFGGVDTRLVFPPTSTSLTASHRELLWYLGNKLLDQKNIRLRISYSKEANPELTDARVEAIIGQLANTGLEGSRIQRYVSQESFETMHTIQLIFTRIAP